MADSERCPWMFHGVTRTELPGGQVRLDLDAWRYTSTTERREGKGPVARAAAPCLTRTVPAQFVAIDGQRRQVYESTDAAEMVAEHVGRPYTPVFQGKGWTVEIESGYPLWQVTS